MFLTVPPRTTRVSGLKSQFLEANNNSPQLLVFGLKTCNEPLLYNGYGQQGLEYARAQLSANVSAGLSAKETQERAPK